MKNRLVIYAKLLKDNLTKDGCEFIMQKIKRLKTDYSELDKILEELGIIEYISYGVNLPTEWHELKTSRVEDGIQTLYPISVNDIVKLYEKVKSTLCNNVTCNGRENGIQLRQAKKIIKMLVHDCYSIAECEDTNTGLWEDDLNQAKQFIGEEE